MSPDLVALAGMFPISILQSTQSRAGGPAGLCQLPAENQPSLLLDGAAPRSPPFADSAVRLAGSAERRTHRRARDTVPDPAAEPCMGKL